MALIQATDWSHPRGVRPPGSFRSTSRQELALALQAAAQDESRMAAVRHVALSLGLGPVRDEVLREELLRRFDSRTLTAIWIPDAGIFDGPLSAIPSGLELYRPGMRGQGAALQPTRGINVAAMPMEDRCIEVLKRAAPLVPGDMRDEFLAIVQMESLLTGAAIAIAVILVSPLGTVGAIVAGLAVGASAIFIGLEVFQAAGLLVEAFDLIRRAGSEADLDRAAETFAQVFSKVAVSFVMAYLTKAARGARKRRVEGAKRSANASSPGPERPLAATGRQDGPPSSDLAPEMPPNRRRRTPTFQRVDERVPKEWLKPDGSPDWDKLPKDGFANGKSFPSTLKPGTVLDRYGSGSGTFLSPAGTPFELRSLPWAHDPSKLRTYRVIKDLEVQEGAIAPGFGRDGGGTQFKTGKSIDDLLGEFLEEVK